MAHDILSAKSARIIAKGEKTPLTCSYDDNDLSMKKMVTDMMAKASEVAKNKPVADAVKHLDSIIRLKSQDHGATSASVHVSEIGYFVTKDRVQDVLSVLSEHGYTVSLSNNFYNIEW